MREEIEKFVEENFRKELIEAIKTVDLNKFITYDGETFTLDFRAYSTCDNISAKMIFAELKKQNK